MYVNYCNICCKLFKGLACQKSSTARSVSLRGVFQFEYLGENKFLRKNILACLSGAQTARPDGLDS